MGATTFSVTTLDIMTLGIMGLVATLTTMTLNITVSSAVSLYLVSLC
jgi:hypothetical protein